MEEIKITKITSKDTKLGKPYKMCEVEVGGEIRKVNIWSNAPDFANIKEGSIIMGNMEMDGQYWNIKFENAAQRGNPNFKSQQIEKVMEKKNESIGKFQDSKNESIILASTFRDATLLTVAQISKLPIDDEITEKGIEEMWMRWRTWLANHWGDKLSDIQEPF